MASLNDPLELRHGRTLPNHLVLAPMTNLQSHPDGTISDIEIDWLLARARGGFGITMTAAAYVNPAGQVWPGQLGISSDAHIAGLERLAREVAAAGSVSSVQLHHGGVKAIAAVSGHDVVGPWADAQTGVRELSTGEVQQVVDDFAAAALRAEKAGIDGVEVHGGHGYLVGQFLDESNNTREDGYGGDSGGRARFVHEVMRAIRGRTGPDFQVGLRLSVERYGLVPDEMVDLVADLLAGGDLDYIDLSLWDVRKLPVHAPEGSRMLIEDFLELPRHGTALGVAGHIASAADAQWVLDQGADLGFVGKAAIADHAFAQRAMADAGYRAPNFPVTKDHLRAEMLGEPFVEYFATNWPHLVTA
ncbi:2,4-dienoyl-CoA reductase [Raineyella antarctica]|uniref:2,4-dienoyl-CoA reductase n=1 Tax=Raineyella antarctica TaxID=1577474 RepID=A0A1G6IC55_9ACTN|nr:NADH:flavin oxidoreductase [Raineyella antarctica]SDC03953.1 2,4-dienoyl-CoA reductase [Raineyella antarctica]